MLNYLPCYPGQKRPLVGWKQYQTKHYAFDITGDRGIVCGRISGGLEVLDFDDGGSQFEPWASLVRASDPALYERLVIEQTPSGGFHVFYRCPFPEGDQKLALKQDKSVLIETRGEGGFIKCSPSRGYNLVQKTLEDVELITSEERDTLVKTARLLDRSGTTWQRTAADRAAKPAVEPVHTPKQQPTGFCADSLREPQYRPLIEQHLCSLGFIPLNSTKGLYGHRDAANPRDVKIELHDDNSVFVYASSNVGGLDASRNYTPLSIVAHALQTSDADALRQTAASLGLSTKKTQPTAVERAKTEAAEPDVELTPQLSRSVIDRLPSLLREFMIHVEVAAYSPQVVCSLFSYLSVAGHFINGKIAVPAGQYRGVQPRVSLNPLIISETGSGKDYVQSYFSKLIWKAKHINDGAFEEFLDCEPGAEEGAETAADLETKKDLVLNRCGSQQFLQQKLAETDGEAFLIFDEAKDVLCRRSSTGDLFLACLKNVLEKDFNTEVNLVEGINQAKWFQGKNLRTRTSRCNVTALFFAPSDFARSLTREDIEGGLVGRFCFVFGEPRAKVLKLRLGVSNDTTPREIDVNLLSCLDCTHALSYRYTNDDDKTSELLKRLVGDVEGEDSTCRIASRLWGLASTLAFIRAFSDAPIGAPRLPWQGTIECNQGDMDLAYDLLAYCKACADSMTPEIIDASLTPADRSLKITQAGIMRAIGQLCSKKLRGGNSLDCVPDLPYLLTKRPSLLRHTTFSGALAALNELYKLGRVDFDLDRDDHLPRNIFIKKVK